MKQVPEIKAKIASLGKRSMNGENDERLREEAGRFAMNIAGPAYMTGIGYNALKAGFFFMTFFSIE